MQSRILRAVKSASLLMGLLAVVALAGEVSAAAKQAPTAPVDVNSASIEQLTKIPGIGNSKAQAIIDYRTTKPFATAEELTKVKGIGEKLFAKISPFVTVIGAPQAKTNNPTQRGQ